jgi:hypothetical protein
MLIRILLSEMISVKLVAKVGTASEYLADSQVIQRDQTSVLWQSIWNMWWMYQQSYLLNEI